MFTSARLECQACKAPFPHPTLVSACHCGGLALAQYDLETIRQSWSREWLAHAPPTLWRYAPLLPAPELASVVSLGEGMTPLLKLEKLGPALGLQQLWLKDEGQNPGGLASARAAACWFTVTRILRPAQVVLPSCSPQTAVFALYAARSGTPFSIQESSEPGQLARLMCTMIGADDSTSSPLTPQGHVRAQVDNRSPYCLEGLKTLGLELAEQLRWSLPDAVIVPEGDGNLTVGIWKAFQELASIQWVQGTTPRFYVVQSRGCCPLFQAWRERLDSCQPCPDPRAIGALFKARRPVRDELLLRIVRESGGAVLAVDDQEMIDAGLELARSEGAFASLEGAATLCAARELTLSGHLRASDVVVLINPASGFWSTQAYGTRFRRPRAADPAKHGGLILPR